MTGRSKYSLGLVMAAVLLTPPLFAGNQTVSPGKTQARIKSLQRALVHYQHDNAASCPPSVDTLYEQNYLIQLPRDEWGHPIHFQCPGLHSIDGADISSPGADGVFGSADDIHSWEL